MAIAPEKVLRGLMKLNFAAMFIFYFNITITNNVLVDTVQGTKQDSTKHFSTTFNGVSRGSNEQYY